MSHDEVVPPGQLRREYVLNPITALAFLTFRGSSSSSSSSSSSLPQQYLLTAEDTDIKIYDSATSRQIGVIPVFRAQPIHGIYVSDGAGAPQVLVWGGCAVQVLPGSIFEALIHGGGIATRAEDVPVPGTIAPDWIFDGRISPFDDHRIVLLTAHNEVIQGHVGADTKTITLGRVQSPSRPILYSGNLSWIEPDCVLVAAGTVFGEIVVWKCHLQSGLNGTDTKDTCQVLYVFSGHQGSIFGVHISPEFQTSTGDVIRLLASCSDDRTIRIWDITENRDQVLSNGDKGYEAQISDARQTGFGDSITGSIGSTNVSQSRCIATAMGHVSRIWQVRIQTQTLLSRDLIEVYSFGEDATVQRWHLELGGPSKTTSKIGGSEMRPPVRLTHSETFSNHSGKHIWSHAILSSADGLLIASGGGDGKIALMSNDLVRALTTPDDNIAFNGRYPRFVQEIDVSPQYLIEKCQHQALNTVPRTSTFRHGNGKEMFQSFAFISHDTLLITTRSGRLFLGSFGNETEWEELAISDTTRTTIQSYTILRCSRKTSTAFIGAPNGELFCYHRASGDSLRSIHKAERKITEIICLSDTWGISSPRGHDLDGEVEILVTVFGSRKAEILRISRDHSVTQRTEVTVPGEFIVTSAAWCHNHLILGSRNGNITIFDLAGAKGSDSPLLTMEVNVGDKVTSILPLPQTSETSPPYFLTTARDGKYRIYEIVSNPTTTSDIHIRLLHETKPPFGPLIEGSWLFDHKPDSDSDGRQNKKQDLMLCGFRGKDFIVWNATHQIEVATFDCGGGHRVFDHAQIRNESEGFRFACTKASQMKIFSQSRAPHLPLKSGGHGREIKAVSASGRYVATGAEDTMIQIWELCDGRSTAGRREGSRLRYILALEKHNTGIQTLKWFGDQYLFSSGGNEEFFAWRITGLESDICPLGVVCEAVFPDRSEVGDLRITDFDVHCLPTQHNAEEADGRTGPTFCISMALSNSTVQSYLYSAQRGFELLGRRTYTGACLTQLRHLAVSGKFYPQVLTAATDGHIAIFSDVRSREEDAKGIIATKLHQSTIKSLDMHSITTEAGTSYLVVTGGDDNAIGVLHFYSPSSEPSIAEQDREHHTYEIRNKSVVRSAHAAAVTGLGIVRLENEGRDAVIVTASNDQRVKTWRLVGWQSSSLKVQLVDDRYSGVADAGDLEVVGDKDGERKVLVGGVGAEVWRVA